MIYQRLRLTNVVFELWLHHVKLYKCEVLLPWERIFLFLLALVKIHTHYFFWLKTGNINFTKGVFVEVRDQRRWKLNILKTTISFSFSNIDRGSLIDAYWLSLDIRFRNKSWRFGGHNLKKNKAKSTVKSHCWWGDNLLL